MIRKSIFWTFSAQIASFGIVFVGSLVLARLLSPREMGIYTVALAAIGVLQILAAFGLSGFVVRATELDARTLDTAFTINAIINVSLGILIFGFSHRGAQFLHEPAVANVMQVIAVAPIVSMFDFRPASMLQREMQFKQVSVVTTLQAFLSTGVTIGAATMGASYMSPAYGNLASAITGVVGYSLMGRQHVALRLSTSGWKPMAVFGFRMMSIGGTSALASRLSDIILGRLLGLDALGIFGRASSVSNLVFQNVYGSATRLVFAKLSTDFRERGQIRNSFLKGLRIVAAVMGPILIGLAVLSKPAVLILFGEKWLGAAAPLSFLMIAQFISLRYAMNWELFVIKDELHVQTKIEICRSVGSLITRTIASLFNIAAVGAASIIDAIFSVALYGRHINRLIDATEQELRMISAEAFLITIAAVAPSFVLMVWSGWDAYTPLLLIFACVALGIALWVVILAWRMHPLFDEIRIVLSVAVRQLRRIPLAAGTRD